MRKRRGDAVTSSTSFSSTSCLEISVTSFSNSLANLRLFHGALHDWFLTPAKRNRKVFRFITRQSLILFSICVLELVEGQW